MPPELHYEVKREMGGMGCANGSGMTESCITAINDPRDTDEHIAAHLGQADLRSKCASCWPTAATRRPTSTANCASGANGSSRAISTGAQRDGVRRRRLVLHRRRRPSDPDGYVVVTGRLKDIIIRKGENISAKEVEDLLYAHPDDRRRRGHRAARPRAAASMVCAVVTMSDGRTLTLADLARYCIDAGRHAPEDPRATRDRRRRCPATPPARCSSTNSAQGSSSHSRGVRYAYTRVEHHKNGSSR